MKKRLLILFLFLPFGLQAQFVVGPQGMTIQSFALVCIDSLILSPGNDFTLANNQLTRIGTHQSVNSGNSLDRIYNFASPIVYSGTIGFKYSDAELAGNTEANLQLIHSAANTGSVWITTSGNSLNTVSNTLTNVVANAAISRVSATSASPLPVTLMEFTAIKEEKRQVALLYWEVANEVNLGNYYVERSTDGNTFTRLGSIKAEARTAYDFTDPNPKNGVNYYQLQLVDLDGSYSYSPVRTLIFDNSISLNVYPNPVKGAIVTIHTTDKNLDGKMGYVTDVAGKGILSFKLAGEKTMIDTDNWLPGAYFIHLENGMVFKIVKL